MRPHCKFWVMPCVREIVDVVAKRIDSPPVCAGRQELACDLQACFVCWLAVAIMLHCEALQSHLTSDNFVTHHSCT